jgi:hypothetical protein
LSEGDDIQEAADAIYRKCGGDARQLALYAAQYQALAQRAPSGSILVLAGVSASGSPFVQMTIGEEQVMQTPDRARELAGSLLDGAYGAETDAAVFNFMRAKLDWTDEQAMEMLARLREEQQQRAGNGPVGPPGAGWQE